MDFKPLIKILIYVLDDEADILKFIKIAFDEAGIENYKLFTKPKQMLQDFNEDVQICVLDYRLNDELTGVDVMRVVRRRQPLVDCIFMSNLLDLDTVIDIVNEGGRTRFVRKDKPDFLEKLVFHVKEAAVETDTKIRAVLKSAVRIKDTIDYMETIRAKYDKVQYHS